MNNSNDERLVKISERLNRVEAAVEALSDRVASLEYEKRHLRNEIDILQEDVIRLHESRN